jgi:hypothetical protein
MILGRKQGRGIFGEWLLGGWMLRLPGKESHSAKFTKHNCIAITWMKRKIIIKSPLFLRLDAESIRGIEACFLAGKKAIGLFIR